MEVFVILVSIPQGSDFNKKNPFWAWKNAQVSIPQGSDFNKLKEDEERLGYGMGM